jgi:hypothetical protein
MTQPTDAHIDRILRYIDALHANPDAASPPGLDATDIALARDLARTFAQPALGNAVGNAQRQRIWQRALAEAVRQRLAEGALPAQSHTHIQSNGRFARQETESMLAQPALPQRVPRTTSNAIWLTGLVAAVCALVIGGLLLAGLGDSKPPDTGPDAGAGVGATTNGDQQIADATPTLTATPTTTPIPAFITVGAPTEFRMQASSTPTATPSPPFITVVTPTLVPVLPNSGPTALPFTVTPILPRPTLSPDDFAGIYQHMWREYFRDVEPLWSDDGRYLLVAWDDTVEIFEMGASAEVSIASGHEGNITTMAINPLGTVLATGTEKGEVHLYILPDAEDWIALEVCEDCTIAEVAFNPTGSYLMVYSKEDYAVHIHVYAMPEVFYR